MNKILIETDHLTKRYGKFTALDNISIQLKEGEIYGLIMKNGAGKTTLMRILAGLSIPTSGHILLFHNLSVYPLIQRKRQKIFHLE